MQYEPLSDKLTITTEEAKRAAYSMLYAIRSIRLAVNLPLDKYEQKGPLEPADHAMKGILDAAASLGMDLGARWGNELDVRTAL